MKTPYNEEYFSQVSLWSRPSADVVVPIVLESLAPRRVIDIGCGEGSWLAAFSRLAGCKIVGVDGSNLPRRALAIDPAVLVQCDLSRPLDFGYISAFSQGSRFDLAISLEVAEHLPRNRGASFVHDLTQLAPAVLFSAAVPKQGGTNHINEQWQSYWASMFYAEGFLPRDSIRPRIWGDKRVAFWYQQNMVLYMKGSGSEAPAPSFSSLDLVHPEVLRRVSTPSIGELARSLPRAFRNAASSRLRGFAGHRTAR